MINLTPNPNPRMLHPPSSKKQSDPPGLAEKRSLWFYQDCGDTDPPLPGGMPSLSSSSIPAGFDKISNPGSHAYARIHGFHPSCLFSKRMKRAKLRASGVDPDNLPPKPVNPLVLASFKLGGG